ncbi:Recombinase [Desulfocicer vacuolatum DSM 3385]|uniref:Recombinase n=1 Tax=Desulfocicer vacuolatum DSM 3385 TaxID=1121400 RepID=A0A1W2AEB0_9BACT|nr:recombinase family protein [Desulfocicer vacuolatum]SMC59017.1 Recombinase [Desulfocicer vacuolatum DSM 3385]
MNEFLKNLRNPQRSQKSRFSATTRKGAEGNFHPSVDKRRNKERRSSQPPSFDDLTQESDTLIQALPTIKAHLTTISTAVERMCETGEKLAETQAELHRAITCFFNNVNDILTEKVVPQGATGDIFQEKGNTTAPPPLDGERFTKAEVIRLIQEMREKRCTFGEIALELKARGIPTFSGRGEWHAQTIHRLCRK